MPPWFTSVNARASIAMDSLLLLPRAHLAAARLGFSWDPHLHPRDHQGRFIEKDATVELKGRSGLWKVTGNQSGPDGKTYVEVTREGTEDGAEPEKEIVPGSDIRVVEQPDEVEVDDEDGFDRLPDPELRGEESNALAAYMYDGYKDINQAVRGNDPTAWSRSVRGTSRIAVRDAIENLDSLMARNTVPQGMTVYRGLSLERTDPEDLKEGAEIRDLGYMSTSVDEESAEGFADEYEGTRRATVRIKVPRGSRGVKVVNDRYHNESEWLADRGSSIRIDGISQDPYDEDMYYIDGTLIQPPFTPSAEAASA